MDFKVSLLLCFVLAVPTTTITLEKSIQSFSAAVYRKLAKADSGNILVSPLSVHKLLALTQFGAKNETGEEIRVALHLPSTEEEIAAAFKSVLPVLRGSQQYTLRSANKIYVQGGYPVLPKFIETSREIFGADSENINFFEKQKAADTINGWIERQTQNKIKDLVDPDMFTPDSAAILVDSIYFKAPWEYIFSSYRTKKSAFYKKETEVVQVDTMYNYDAEALFKYYDDKELDAKMLELPFESDEASMIIVLPNAKNGIQRLEENIEKIVTPVPFENKYVKIALPKFRFESTINFKKILQNLGVNKAFIQGEADLSNIGGKKGELFISDVLQKSFIDVNENGVEAAAATFVHVVSESAIFHEEDPIEFVADHPYIFYIKVKGLVVFIGKLADP